MNDVGLAVALAILLSVTTGFVALRVSIDIQRYRSIPSRPTLASLICFCLSWACFVGAMGCELWVLNQTLDVTQRGRAVAIFLPSVGVGIEYLELGIKLSLIAPSFLLLAGSWLVKGSFYVMNFNIAPHLPRKAFRLWALYLLGVYLVLSFLANIFVLAFWCHPMSSIWKISLAGNMIACNPADNMVPATTYLVLNVSSDLYTMAVPMLIIRKLQLNRRDRYGFVFLLFLGCCTVFAAAARAGLLLRVNQLVEITAQAALTPEGITLLYLAQVFGMGELAVALIAGSLPSLRMKIYRNVRREERARREGLVTIGGSGGSGGEGKLDANDLELSQLTSCTDFQKEGRASSEN